MDPFFELPTRDFAKDFCALTVRMNAGARATVPSADLSKRPRGSGTDTLTRLADQVIEG